MLNHKFLLSLFCSLLFTSFIFAETALEKLIRKKVPNVTSVTKLKNSDHFKEVYEIMIRQPLDHADATKGYFEQRVFLSHTNRKRPMLIVTEGYSARQRTYELSKILNSNQLIVEYRYFGKSTPQKMDWTYLKNDLAMEDLHKLRTVFGKIYKKKWISTGISKGGSTTLIYKSAYPKDVKVAIPYVAPLAIAQEDKRTDEHILSIGSEECRNKLDAFQKVAMKNRTAILPFIEEWAKEKSHQFTYVSIPAAFEYAVLEYTFSFWQWGHDCAKVPSVKASPKEIFEHLNEIVGFNFYSDATCQYFLPAFYQFITELGYYGFIQDHVKQDMVALKHANNIVFAPQDTDLTFTPYCQKVIDYLDVNGDNIIYIYGEIDPWTACGYYPTKATNALRMDLKGGSHTTRIASYSQAEQNQIYQQLEKWLKMKVKPLPKSKK